MQSHALQKVKPVFVGAPLKKRHYRCGLQYTAKAPTHDMVLVMPAQHRASVQPQFALRAKPSQKCVQQLFAAIGEISLPNIGSKFSSLSIRINLLKCPVEMFKWAPLTRPELTRGKKKMCAPLNEAGAASRVRIRRRLFILLTAQLRTLAAPVQSVRASRRVGSRDRAAPAEAAEV